jgi:hypothetical protein
MKKVVFFLRRHRWLHLGLLLLYCLAVILPHEQVGLWIVSWIEHMPRAEMDRWVLGIGIGLVAVLSLPFWLRLPGHPERKAILLYLGLTACLVVLCYQLLFILPTEIAHFPQYALMAIMLFPLSLRYGESLFWATLIGALDESYQYFWLAPERTLYYDWNDVLTNFLGAALGLIYLWAFFRTPPLPHSFVLSRSPALLTALALLLLGLVLNLAGLLHVNPPPEGASGLVLLRQPISGFWTPTRAPGISRFHLVHSLEALALLLGLFWGYRKLGRFSKDE